MRLETLLCSSTARLIDEKQIALLAHHRVWSMIADCHRLGKALQEFHRIDRHGDVLFEVELDAHVPIRQHRGRSLQGRILLHDNDLVGRVEGQEVVSGRPTGGRTSDYHGLGHTEWVMPPSTLRFWPVMYPAWSESKKATVSAISSTVPTRPIGIRATLFSSAS